MCVINFLSLNYLTAGKLRIVEAPFNLYECIDSALEMVASMAAEKELELAYRVACSVPPKLVGDSGRLKQIMLNLLCTQRTNQIAAFFMLILFFTSKCDQVY